ncbi:MAG: hypothetical protein DRJ30_06550 [Candidatus Methanomethylicota archaeon]|nr:MAG: hypothetical protein DRJ30_06550 [Candidatus Verstraetearchaeota archaeon]
MMSKLDQIVKEILNDRKIFYLKNRVITKDEINEFRKMFEEGRRDEIKRILEEKKKQSFARTRKLLVNLIDLLENNPHILRSIIKYLDEIGEVTFNLSRTRLDDLGKVIERYPLTVIEAFFLEKSKKCKDKYEKRAILRLFNYVEEALNEGVDRREIAYIVRKLNNFESLYKINDLMVRER